MPLSEKQKASNKKWDAANLKRMSLAIPITLYDKMQKHVQDTKETTNRFIRRAITETIENDERKPAPKIDLDELLADPPESEKHKIKLIPVEKG